MSGVDKRLVRYVGGPLHGHVVPQPIDPHKLEHDTVEFFAARRDPAGYWARQATAPAQLPPGIVKYRIIGDQVSPSIIFAWCEQLLQGVDDVVGVNITGPSDGALHLIDRLITLTRYAGGGGHLTGHVVMSRRTALWAATAMRNAFGPQLAYSLEHWPAAVRNAWETVLATDPADAPDIPGPKLPAADIAAMFDVFIRAWPAGTIRIDDDVPDGFLVARRLFPRVGL